MDLATYLDQRNISETTLSAVSGVSRSTINDIIKGKNEIGDVDAKTVFKLSQALNCTMEDMINFSSNYQS